jgi:hypothetical protein
MANEVMRRTVVELDGFNDFTNEIEGEEDRTSSRVIQGTKIGFDDPRWLDNNTGKDITGKPLTAVGVLNVINKWSHDNMPLETRILAPGEKFPNFDKLNAECDQSEWRERFGKMTGPWAGQHVVYFIDDHYNKYSWPSPILTIGSAICVRELAEQIKMVRAVKGKNVCPVTKLGHIDFKTSYGLRQRPFLLDIVDWVILGSDQSDPLPAPDTKPPAIDVTPTPATEGQGAPPDAQSVGKPTAKEVTRDEIPW